MTNAARLQRPPERRGARAPRRATSLVALVAAAGLFDAGCGLSIDQRTVAIPASEVPAQLSAETTTTSTTTTTTTTTTPVSAPPSTATINTDPELAARTVPVFYPEAGLSNDMYPFPVTLSPKDDLDDLIALLARPEPGNLRTAVTPKLINYHIFERGILTVDLNSEMYGSLLDRQQRQAIAQMVLTFTSYNVPGEGNIGFVSFSVAGEPWSVIIPGSEQRATRPGEAVTYADFASLIVAPSERTADTTEPAATVESTVATSLADT